MEEKIKDLKSQIESTKERFNWKEIPHSLKKEFDDIYLEASKSDNERDLENISHWMYERYVEFKKAKCRYIIFDIIDKTKYTPFYSVLRSAYETSYPDSMHNYKDYPWHILDMAIFQMESELKDIFRGEIDFHWDVKFTGKFSPSNDYYLHEVDDFLFLYNVVDRVDDYFITEVIEKYFFNGYDGRFPEMSEELLYVSRISDQTYRIDYYEAWSDMSFKLYNQIRALMKDLGELLTSKYTANELKQFIGIEDGYEREYMEWYNSLQKSRI